MLQNDINDTKPRIRPSDFFSSGHEKTKLNWFLYEYALELHSYISRDKILHGKLTRRNINSAMIAAFCVYHAKYMRNEILNRLSGKAVQININYQPIEAFFPTIGDRLVNQLLTKVSKAWDSQTEVCVSCPTRCISEKDQKAPMFDDPYYYTEE